MQITEVRIKLMEKTDDRLRAFCSITFDDCFVIRDLKIIDGAHGPFVAMPSRKLTTHCPQCGAKNHLRALYCNQCGTKLAETRPARDQAGRVKLYADIAHPINSECREMVQQTILREYEEELKRFEQPGYVSRYDDTYGEDDLDAYEAFDELEGRGVPMARRVSTPQIQPAEPSPPPPHRPIPRANPHTHPADAGDAFGAGIFDD